MFADRGGALSLVPPAAASDVRWPAVARSGSLRLGAGAFSVWLQVRGEAEVRAREGRFVLRPGDWLAFERDSMPDLVAGRHGVTLGVVLPPGGGRQACDLLPGRGRMARGDLRIALRLWRGGHVAAARRDAGADRAVAAMLRHLAIQQRDLDHAVVRCPGRSLRRKRQVLGRLQRARLFLEGHRDRVVRLTELAELTSFSSWYLSKTFHGLYDESPQAASVRLRLERACELLARTDDAIGEVGAACGFDNGCSFARAFRAHFRTTASAWRAQARRGAKVGTGWQPSMQGDAADASVTCP
ncbi:MAG: helix-turn-helix domain-containing protein [Lysobacteraceae bacterium]